MPGSVKRRRQGQARQSESPAAARSGEEPGGGGKDSGDAAPDRAGGRGLSEATLQRLLLRVAVLLAAVGVYLYTRQVGRHRLMSGYRAATV